MVSSVIPTSYLLELGLDSFESLGLPPSLGVPSSWYSSSCSPNKGSSSFLLALLLQPSFILLLNFLLFHRITPGYDEDLILALCSVITPDSIQVIKCRWAVHTANILPALLSLFLSSFSFSWFLRAQPTSVFPPLINAHLSTSRQDAPHTGWATV